MLQIRVIGTPDGANTLKWGGDFIPADFEWHPAPAWATVPQIEANPYLEWQDAQPEEPAAAEGELVSATPLPADFPARSLLVDAGFDTVEAVTAASDSDLTDIDGIGSATVQKIRDALS